jgi:hypothetical protein
MHLNSKRFGLFVLLALAPIQAFAAFENIFQSTTRYGPGVLLQSLELKKHFSKERLDENNFFVKKRDIAAAGDSEEAQRQAPLWWTVGFGYSLLTSGVTDHLLTGTLGLGWEDDTDWSFSFLANVDSIPTEEYRHGAAQFSLGYLFHLGKKEGENNRNPASVSQNTPEEDEEEDEYDPSDAVQFYRAQRKANQKQFEKRRDRVIASAPPSLEDEEEAEEDRLPEDVEFPTLRVKAQIGFGHHLSLTKIRRAGDLQGVDMPSVGISQLWYGPTFEYQPKDELKYSLAVNFYSYGDGFEFFSQTLDLGTSARQPLFAVGGWSPYANQILSFPKFTIDEMLEWKLNERDRLLIALNQTFFAAADLGFTLIGNPYFYRDFSRKWRGGIGAAVIISSSDSPLFSASIELKYKL